MRCNRICVRGEGCESPRRGGRTGARAAGWGLPAQGRCPLTFKDVRFVDMGPAGAGEVRRAATGPGMGRRGEVRG